MHKSIEPSEKTESFAANNLIGHKQYQADRLGLARRLHETLAQDLAAIGYQLDGVISDSTLTDQARAELRNIRIAVMESARNFREEIYKLRRTNRVTMHAQLIEILTATELHLDLTYPLLRDREEDLLCEVLLEIARNTLKHSGATLFSLNYETTAEYLTLMVGDNGVGKLSIKRDSFGLRAIDEILREISEGYRCESGIDGTKYVINIPLRNLAQ